MSSTAPEAIGDYRVIARIGHGGMARVFLAIRNGPRNFRKLFVIKQLRPDLHGQYYVEMFLDEARLAALLSHRNVVQTHEVGFDEGRPYISMDYLEGQSLARLLRRVTRSQAPLVLQVYVLAEILAALEYAHALVDLEGNALSVVHRDISPSNVFLTYDGVVKLLDFGVAKSRGRSTQTEVGVLKGKLVYMAPEQAAGNEVDRRSDLFSVGVMLWEAIAERRFVPPQEADAVTLHNRINGLWHPISEVSPGAFADLLAACEKAMALDPEARFQTAGEFRQRLLACLARAGMSQGRDALGTFVRAVFSLEREALTARISACSGHDVAFEEAVEETRAMSLAGRTLHPVAPPLQPDPLSAVTSLKPKRQFRRNVVIGGALVLAAALALGYQRGDGSPSVDEVAAESTSETVVDATIPTKRAGLSPVLSSAHAGEPRATGESRGKNRLLRVEGKRPAPAKPPVRSLAKQTTPRTETSAAKKKRTASAPKTKAAKKKRTASAPRTKTAKKKRTANAPKTKTAKKKRTASVPKTKTAKRAKAPKRETAPRTSNARPKPIAPGDPLSSTSNAKSRRIDEKNPYQ